MQLARSISSSASAAKRRKYLADMEEQCLFREHRPMDLGIFQTKLLKEKGIPSLSTLRGW
jgi:hypothetical protein